MSSSTASRPWPHLQHQMVSAKPTTAQVAAILADIRHSLKAMAESGCAGFDVTPENLERVRRWGAPANATQMAGPHSAAPSSALDGLDSLGALRTDLGDCQRCGLAAGRTQIVFGSGSPSARLVFVGEGPGREEDLSGEPFVGPAGELLTKIISAMNLTRTAVYICNVVKCRPPGNRRPGDAEMAACLPYLRAQLRVIQPTVICTLGACASHALLETDTPISRLRGHFHPYPAGLSGCQVMPTFHPAYLLRHPQAKRAVWNDMQQIMRVLRETAHG